MNHYRVLYYGVYIRAFDTRDQALAFIANEVATVVGDDWEDYEIQDASDDQEGY